MPVGLDDAIPRREASTHVVVDVGKYFREKGLVVLAEGQGIPVLHETVDKILGQVGTADHTQLAEKGQTSTV